MIYVSTAGIAGETIKERILRLVDLGFSHIELSGGTNYYKHWAEDVLGLQQKHNLTLLCHNYFPPVKTEFVLNASSSDATIRELSIEQLRRGLEFSAEVGGDKFGFHSGFLFDPEVEELGNEMSKNSLISRNTAVNNMMETFAHLQADTKGTRLYLENNVINQSTFDSFNEQVPFLMVRAADVIELIGKFKVLVLLDIGHLKVSCKTLGLSLEKELAQIWPKTDYIHMSDNDGQIDNNLTISHDSVLFDLLQSFDWQGKTVTLEIDGENELREAYETCLRLVKDA